MWSVLDRDAPRHNITAHKRYTSNIIKFQEIYTLTGMVILRICKIGSYINKTIVYGIRIC